MIDDYRAKQEERKSLDQVVGELGELSSEDSAGNEEEKLPDFASVMADIKGALLNGRLSKKVSLVKVFWTGDC